MIILSKGPSLLFEFVLPRGILLLDSLEGGFFPWPPKTTDEPHSSSLFSVQGERKSPPFSGKPPETLNDLFRSPARRCPFTQKTSIHVFGHVLLSGDFRNAPRVKANDQRPCASPVGRKGSSMTGLWTALLWPVLGGSARATSDPLAS